MANDLTQRLEEILHLVSLAGDKLIDDAIRAYKDGVAQIDKRLSNLNYE